MPSCLTAAATGPGVGSSAEGRQPTLLPGTPVPAACAQQGWGEGHLGRPEAVTAKSTCGLSARVASAGGPNGPRLKGSDQPARPFLGGRAGPAAGRAEEGTLPGHRSPLWGLR